MKKVPQFYRFILLFMGYPMYRILTILRIPNFFIRRRLKDNYQYNAGYELTFPLSGQGVGELSKLRIGKKEFAHSGCCAIALFNALSIVGENMKMCEIVSFLERKGLIVYGMFGINPIAVCKFLKQQRVSYVRYRKTDLIEKDYKEGDSVISLYNWASASGLGAHYVALKKENNIWKAYNVYNTNTEIYEYPDLNAFLAHSAYSRPVTWFLLKKRDK